uniref:Uncharacterized protein n=1 Tax=Siphoviridae sp. ct0d96 TaxID=2826268 RepID=A0A8S5M4X5_9CAUD|nr:MAG TPA: hypothetical protein [Siphoviridae sp. ct0d96]
MAVPCKDSIGERALGEKEERIAASLHHEILGRR